MGQVWKCVIFVGCYVEAIEFAKSVPIMSPGDWKLKFKKMCCRLFLYLHI